MEFKQRREECLVAVAIKSTKMGSLTEEHCHQFHRGYKQRITYKDEKLMSKRRLVSPRLHNTMKTGTPACLGIS